MPKGSAALTKARREEIVQACARLYETRSFREITLKEIGAQTTFTRTSIYNYFHTKEEIFLALLQQEHEAWNQDLAALQHCLEVFFPAMTGEDRQAFLYAFFPFLFGVYPYTTATEKQKQAMDLAHIHYPRYSIYTITKSLVAKLLQPFQ